MKSVLILIIFVYSSFALAQSGLETFCRDFLTINIRDEADLFSAMQKSDLVRSILFDQQELEYSTAQSIQAELGIPILEVIDLTLGGETTAESWTRRKDTFLQDVLSSATKNAVYRSEISRINNAFFTSADRCIETLAAENENRENFFPIVTMRSYRQFEVDIEYRINPGNPRPLVVNLDAFPAEGVECRPSLPFRIRASNQRRTIRCVKPEEEPIFLTIRSNNLGDKGSFDLPGGGELPLLRRDLEELEAVVATLSPIASGTVAAFNLSTCPADWSTFSEGMGRAIIGIGEAQGLTTRTLMEQGGEETHKLTIDEMPAHNHGGQTQSSGASMNYNYTSPAAGRFGEGGVPFSQTEHNHAISTEGGDAPHNNMPPFVALLLCQKN